MERAEDLGETLDKVAVETDRYALLIHLDADRDTGQIDVLVGHPIRSSLVYTSPAGSRYIAMEPGVEPLGWVITGDRNGEFHPFPAAATRLTPDTARLAVTAWLNTGQRPDMHIPMWVAADD